MLRRRRPGASAESRLFAASGLAALAPVADRPGAGRVLVRCLIVGCLVFGCLFAAGLYPTRCQASTLERGGLGARGLGFAGAGPAAATGAAATYDNPAALGGVDRAEALLSATILRYHVAISRGGGEAQWPTVTPQSLTLGSAAVAVPVTRDLGVGLLVHLPVNGPSRLLSFDHRRPQLPLWQGLGERLAIAASAGYRVNGWLAIGLTGHVAADLDARASFGLSLGEGRFTQQDLDVHLRSRIVPALAFQLRPTQQLRVLLRWRAAYEVTYTVPLELDVVGVGLVAVDIAGTGLLSPEMFTAAAAWRVRPGTTLVATVSYERWSDLPPLSPTVSVVAGGDPAWLEAYAAPPAPGAVDTVVAHVGASRRLSSSFTVRAGAGFRPTPLPRASGAASWLDSHAVECGVGGSWRALPRLEVDIAARWSHLLSRRVTKANAADPIGFVGVAGEVFHVALTLRHKLSDPAKSSGPEPG